MTGTRRALEWMSEQQVRQHPVEAQLSREGVSIRCTDAESVAILVWEGWTLHRIVCSQCTATISPHTFT